MKLRPVLRTLAGFAAAAAIGTVAHAYATNARWGSTDVVFLINPQNADVTAAAAEAAVRAGMDVWGTQGGSPFRYIYGGKSNDTTTGYDGRNVVIFRNASSGGALASTYSWWSGDTMLDADIIFWDGAYTFFTGTSGCSSGAYIEDIATHELGHALGLQHSTVADASMYPSYMYCSQDTRTLASDDIDGLRSLYGRSSGGTSNTPPVVSITAPGSNASFASGESITFTGTASDSQDGALTGSLSWSSNLDGYLGTGGSLSRILSSGSHVIAASVTDSGGASASQQVSITVAAAPTGGTSPTGVPALNARGYKVKTASRVELTWSGSAASSVDVYRNGSRLRTTANDGLDTDSISKRGGTFTYKVCNAGTASCSNQVNVTF